MIKRYPDGEVSRWMHRLNVGDDIKVRGPAVTWFQREVYDEVVFVSDFLRLVIPGTSLTPRCFRLWEELGSRPLINISSIYCLLLKQITPPRFLSSTLLPILPLFS